MYAKNIGVLIQLQYIELLVFLQYKMYITILDLFYFYSIFIVYLYFLIDTSDELRRSFSRLYSNY